MPRDISISDHEEEEVPSSDLNNTVMIPDSFDFNIRNHPASSDDPYPSMARPQIRRSHRRSSMIIDDSKRSSTSTNNDTNTSGTNSLRSLPKSNSNSSISIIGTAQLPSSPYLYSNTTSVIGIKGSSSFNNLTNIDSSFSDSHSYHTANTNIPSSPVLNGNQSDSAVMFSSPVYPERHSSHSWKSSPSVASRQNFQPRSISAGHHPLSDTSSIPGLPGLSGLSSNSGASSTSINSGTAAAGTGKNSAPHTPYKPPPTPSSPNINNFSGSSPQLYSLSSPGLSGGITSGLSNISLNSSPLIATPLKYTLHSGPTSNSGTNSGSYSPGSVYSPSPPAAPLTTYANATTENTPPPLPNLPSSRFKSNPIDLTIQTPSKPEVRSQSIVISPASVSWRANEPNEWTNDRVIQWLEVNKFGPDWIQTFKSRNIHGTQFLSLVNYTNLKKLGPFSTRNEDYDTSPSRFIHILRKLLNKSSSTNSTNSNDGEGQLTNIPTPIITPIVATAPSPQPPQPPQPLPIQSPSIPVPSHNSSIDTYSTSAPRNSSSIEDSSTSLKNVDIYDPATISPLERIASNPINPIEPKVYDNFLDYRYNIFPRPRTTQIKPRPMSTFESSSKSSFNQPPISPSFRAGFLRRHNKSNSSESSLVLPQSNSVTSLLEADDASTKDLKVNIIEQPEHRKNRGIFKKFRMRDRSKSRDNLRVDSPTSPSDQILKRSPTTEKYLFLDQKYRPHKEHNQQIILVTRDNKSFSTILIPLELSTISEIKSLIANLYNLSSTTMDIHLTDFGHAKGEPLEDSMIHDILLTQQSEVVKFYITYQSPPPPPPPPPPPSPPPPVTRKSNSSLSLNALTPQSDIDQKYPDTPAYMINNGNSNNGNSDYFNTNRLQVPDSKKQASVKIQITDAELFPTISTSSDHSGRRTSDDSFKVIRPARREINFDDRRSSPYDRKPSANLVALREAPPPPSRSQSIKSIASLKRHSTLDRKNSKIKSRDLSPSKSLKEKSTTRVTLNTRDVPPNSNLKTYSPGHSENLIPMPYVGNTAAQNTVARKPIRRDSDSSSRYSSPSLNDSSSTTTKADALPPIFKVPEFSKSSPITQVNEKPIGPGEKFKFQENEISFEDAPAFIDDDDDDDSSSSDDGLWAKRPPRLQESKPELHVETNTLVANPPSLSPITPYKSASTTASPIRIVDENGESWAVRPPAEVVYENLERFFPNADLDKPIIDDVPLSPIVASEFDATITKSTVLPPLIEPKESPVQQPKWRTQSKPRIDRNTSSSSTIRPSKPDSTDKLKAPSRMKSLRIVAREASEARKRFSSAASSNQGGGALLRRKSTKMWGQKVVEMTPNEIRNGNLSTLRDQKGEFKQFVWVKGELIGKGTFGKVYLALNATTGEMMAVKQVEVPQTFGDKESERQREVVGALHSEVETLKDLDHLNIVQYLGFEALPDVYNLFLEYVPGGSVGRCLRMYGRFEEPIIKSLTHQVLDGLSYLHSCGILHRDLKADNLLLDVDGVCKISDFGISKKSRDIYANDAEMSMQGTIFWMAPEVIHNVVHNAKQGYSAKVDVWSLGCVLLEMFAGRRPWSTDEAIGAMYKLGTSRQAPPIPEDTKPFVSELGKDFLDQCFTIDTEKRPTAQRLIQHAFCIVDSDFKFEDTKLGEMIRFNSKRRDRIKH